jgi:hypothetical protein
VNRVRVTLERAGSEAEFAQALKGALRVCFRTFHLRCVGLTDQPTEEGLRVAIACIDAMNDDEVVRGLREPYDGWTQACFEAHQRLSALLPSRVIKPPAVIPTNSE